MQNMHTQCVKLGPELCIHVYYEQLVLHPRLWLERILNFLDVPWNDSVLHHDKLINKPGGVSLSKFVLFISNFLYLLSFLPSVFTFYL